MEKDQVWEKNEFHSSHVAHEMPPVRRPSERVLGKKPGQDSQKGREQTSSTCLGPWGHRRAPFKEKQVVNIAICCQEPDSGED